MSKNPRPTLPMPPGLPRLFMSVVLGLYRLMVFIPAGMFSGIVSMGDPELGEAVFKKAMFFLEDEP